jgi:tRNA pseudouridine38-40 synthase
LTDKDPKKGYPPDHWRVKLLLSYDGTDYSGWQRQDHEKSVQGTVEKALTKFFTKPITLIGASRTDSGVHAFGQVAHFDAPRDPTKGDLRFAINGMLPNDIVVRQAWIAPNNFHAIADAKKKLYRFKILNRWVPSALRNRYTWWVRNPLDVGLLDEASQYLLGTQDFKAFQSTGTVVKTTIRTIERAEWVKKPNDIVEFRIVGDGFLKQMVRNIVGTLVDINQNQRKPEEIRRILQTLDRQKAGPTAPPQGLYLSRVFYPRTLDNECRKL